jgi:acetaldehyde dehydrogenase (acetylating)
MIAEMAGIKVPATTRVLIGRLAGVGRDVPLSGEKLSPILAFYSAPNLVAGIEVCVRLLKHGGLGHTSSIHSQSEVAVKQYGLAMPAFRVVVNTSAVHGSIGYSTNLFPAMTLGCGSPGGNITSDNIGPQHLMNVKRVAWESRAIEHRTIPADQRLAGSTSPASDSRPQAAPAVAGASANASASAAAPAAEQAQTPGDSAMPDRETIARVVERVLAARGILRGSAPTPGESRAPNAPQTVATPAAQGSAPSSASASGGQAHAGTAAIPPSSSTSSAPPAANASDGEKAMAATASAESAINVVGFVSENEVRAAISQGGKIFIGPKTIITPSARDLGGEHEIFVLTEIVPIPAKKSRHDS